MLFFSASCVLHNSHLWRISPRNPNSGTPFPEDWPIPYPILQGILPGEVWELLEVPGFSLDYTKKMWVFSPSSPADVLIKTSTFTLHSHGNLNDEWSLRPLQWSSLSGATNWSYLSRYVFSAILRNPSSKLVFMMLRVFLAKDVSIVIFHGYYPIMQLYVYIYI